MTSELFISRSDVLEALYAAARKMNEDRMHYGKHFVEALDKIEALTTVKVEVKE